MGLIKLILSLDELLWLLIGVATYGAIAFTYRKLKGMSKFSKGGFTLIILAILTIDFTILWMFESFLENEVRAANMGLISFGAFAVIFALIGYRLITSAQKKTVNVTGSKTSK